MKSLKFFLFVLVVFEIDLCNLNFQTSRDPNKFYWMFEFFMQEPQSVEYGSFLEAR